jgi:hypothetical protein
LWVIAHLFAARRGLQPPPFLLTLEPVAFAAAALVAARLTDSGPWLPLARLAGYAASTPLIDRNLLRDLSAPGVAFQLGVAAVRGL